MENSVVNYYNQHAREKLNGYLNGNKRLEMAWETLCSHAPGKLLSVLEIGCGVGNMSYQMSKRWSKAKIKAIDISKSSIDIANKLFNSNNIEFSVGYLHEITFNKTFDLIVLFDVFEHIDSKDRDGFIKKICELLNPGGTIFLSFPSPTYQDFNYKFHPELMQPVDENITLDVISQLCRTCNAELIFYKNVDVHFEGDYTHAVIKKYFTQFSRFESSVYLKKNLIIRVIKKSIYYLFFLNPVFSRKAIRMFKIKHRLKS